MTNNLPPRPSSVLVGFSIIVIGSCVVPIGRGIKAITGPDLFGLYLVMVFGTLAFAQYVAVFRSSRWFAFLAVVLLVFIDISAIYFLTMSLKVGGHSAEQQQWIRGIACMALIYACAVVLTHRWQIELVRASLSEKPTEPAKNLKLFDLFAITTFAAGLMAYLAAF